MTQHIYGLFTWDDEPIFTTTEKDFYSMYWSGARGRMTFFEYLDESGVAQASFMQRLSDHASGKYGCYRLKLPGRPADGGPSDEPFTIDVRTMGYEVIGGPDFLKIGADIKFEEIRVTSRPNKKGKTF